MMLQNEYDKHLLFPLRVLYPSEEQCYQHLPPLDDAGQSKDKLQSLKYELEP